MLIAIHGVKLYAQSYTCSEALCSLLYMESSFMLITMHGVSFMLNAIQGVKLFCHCYTRS